MEQSSLIGERVVDLIREANGGDWPANIWQWRRVWRRVNVFRLECWSGLSGPFLLDGLIRCPWPPDVSTFRAWVAHETAEAVLLWDGEPPCVCPPGVTAHRAARHAEIVGPQGKPTPVSVLVVPPEDRYPDEK